MRRRNAACEYRPLALLDECVSLCCFWFFFPSFRSRFFSPPELCQHDARREVQ